MLCQLVRPLWSFLLILAASDCIYGQDVNSPPPQRAEQKSLEIKQVKIFAWQLVQKNRKYVEVQDYFLWTTVDFLVAPVTRAYEQMDNSALASSVSWGQMTGMRDLKATPIYWLRPEEPYKWL